MKVVRVRSPFIIQINETGQIGSKIELSIWNKGNAIPTSGSGFYSLSKPIPSTNQINTSYNVSNYVKEFIDNINPNNTFNGVDEGINEEVSTEWVNFRVKRYKLVGTTYTLLDTIDYVGVNGFTNYLDNYQNPSNSVFNLLTNTNINFNYYKSIGYLQMEYINLLIDKLSTTVTSVKYERIDGTVYSFTVNFLISQSGIYNVKIPISAIETDNAFVNGCKVTVKSLPTIGDPTEFIFYTYPIEECKYQTVRCSFINRYGGWKDIIFYKQQTNNISVKGTDYKVLQSSINYNTAIGQNQRFNLNGTQSVKLNTGFVDENYSELITDLLLSETVLLDGKPVTLKTQSSDLKTVLKDRMINYEIDFDYSYNLINDVV